MDLVKFHDMPASVEHRCNESKATAVKLSELPIGWMFVCMSCVISRLAESDTRFVCMDVCLLRCVHTARKTTSPQLLGYGESPV